MMHGREKSDPAVVAMKPAKSAAQAEGELVERRAGAKGKAEQVARTGHRAGHACISNLLRLRHAYTLPSSPKVGARCLNWARRVLCGGRTATCVPTATGPMTMTPAFRGTITERVADARSFASLGTTYALSSCP